MLVLTFVKKVIVPPQDTPYLRKVLKNWDFNKCIVTSSEKADSIIDELLLCM